ncbi:MAG: LCP family protein [Chloroflexota bacterium]
MATIEPPFDDGFHEDGYGYYRRGVNRLLILSIFAFAVLSIWASVAVFSRIDNVLFPGNPFQLPIVGNSIVPGAKGDDPVSAETIDQRINVLVMGLDQRDDEADDQPYRTDSIMILTIDPFSKTAGGFSIPRDTRVDVPMKDGSLYTRTRINEVYENGEYPVLGYPDACQGCGPKLLETVIKNNFDIPIDYYVVLNWKNFRQVIDQLGGVDVTIPEYAYDPAYSTCQFCGEYSQLEFLPGTEHMDGDRALAYARIRHSDNDFKRIERQQIVLRAVIAKAKTLDFLNLGEMRNLYTTYKDSVPTDMPDSFLVGLAPLMQQIDVKGGLANMKLVSMQDATYPCPAIECGNAAELDFYPKKMEELKAQVFSDVQLTTDTATISVLNGTPDNGTIAGDFEDQMVANGLPRYNITSDEYANGLVYSQTVIIDVTGGNQHTVDQIKGWLGVSDARVLTACLGGDDGSASATPTPDCVPDPRTDQFLPSVYDPNTTPDIIVVLGADAGETTSTTGQTTVTVTQQPGG